MRLPLALVSLITAASAIDWHPEGFLEKRADVTFQTIIADFQNITNYTVATGAAASNLTTLLDAITLNGASTSVQAAINKSIEDAKAVPPIDENESLKLIAPIQALALASNYTITAFIEAKPFFVQYGLCMIVYSGLVTQNVTSAEFSELLTSKTPASSRASSASLSEPINDSLARALATYARNCSGDPSLLPAIDVSGMASGRHVAGYWAAGAVALVMAALL